MLKSRHINLLLSDLSLWMMSLIMNFEFGTMSVGLRAHLALVLVVYLLMSQVLVYFVHMLCLPVSYEVTFYFGSVVTLIT